MDSATSTSKRIVIVGGGMAGLTAASLLQKYAPPQPTSILVVDPSPYMTYQPFLPEVAGGHIEPRDVTVPLASSLGRAGLVRGRMTGLDPDARIIDVTDADGRVRRLGYDEAIITTGAITRLFPTPGLAEHGVGFKSVEEAVYVRDTMLANIELAAATDDADERRRLLTCVFVGGGYTGVEALTELQLAALRNMRDHPSLAGEDLRIVLVEALDRVAPEVGPELSAWTLDRLRDRGIDVRLKTTMPSCEDGVVELSDGERIPSALIVWTAGVQPNPVVGHVGLPLGPKGHVNVLPTLQVADDDGRVIEHLWAFGDNAQVPDLSAEKQPAYCPPNAQHAVRQAATAAGNVIASMSGAGLIDYEHASLGTVASYGPGQGAAKIMGVELTNMLAWLAHRGYHLTAMPTFDRKVRILSGWIAEFLGANKAASLGAIRYPRRPIEQSAAALAKPKEKQAA